MDPEVRTFRKRSFCNQVYGFKSSSFSEKQLVESDFGGHFGPWASIVQITDWILQKGHSLIIVTLTSFTECGSQKLIIIPYPVTQTGQTFRICVTHTGFSKYTYL
jgi:hypothetical protein